MHAWGPPARGGGRHRGTRERPSGSNAHDQRGLPLACMHMWFSRSPRPLPNPERAWNRRAHRHPQQRLYISSDVGEAHHAPHLSLLALTLACITPSLHLSLFPPAILEHGSRTSAYDSTCSLLPFSGGVCEPIICCISPARYCARVSPLGCSCIRSTFSWTLPASGGCRRATDSQCPCLTLCFCRLRRSAAAEPVGRLGRLSPSSRQSVPMPHPWLLPIAPISCSRACWVSRAVVAEQPTVGARASLTLSPRRESPDPMSDGNGFR
jgi:hypothetical protein